MDNSQTKRIEFEVAGMIISVSFKDFPAKEIVPVLDKLSRFPVCGIRHPDLCIDVSGQKLNINQISGGRTQGQQVNFIADRIDGVVHINANGFNGKWLDGDTCHAFYNVQACKNGAESVVFSAITYLGMQSERLFLHAASAAIGNEGYVFMGPSGAGKSTVANELISKGIRVFGEEIACVDMSDIKQCKLWPVPFQSVSSSITCGDNSPVSLGKLYCLDRYRIAGIHGTVPMDSCKMIISNLAGIITDSGKMQEVIGLAGRLAGRYPIELLSYDKRHSTVLDVIDTYRM